MTPPLLHTLCALALALTACTPQASTRAYAVPHSRVIDLPTSANGVDYQLYIHVPPACSGTAKCPVVYMLDAEYSFGLAASIVTHLSDRKRIPPLISVAIGYPDKTLYRLNRTRDYTPYFVSTGGYGAEYQRVSGGGPAFLDVIRSQIIPYVETRYPASGERRTLVGHSYGGLFAAWTWLSDPQTFDRYVLVSPSLWYADQRLLAEAAGACEQAPAGPMQAQVKAPQVQAPKVQTPKVQTPKVQTLILGVGEYEEQPQNGHAMVSELRRLDAILRDCSQRDTVAHLRIYDGETHASIFPAALSTGLRTLFQTAR